MNNLETMDFVSLVIGVTGLSILIYCSRYDALMNPQVKFEAEILPLYLNAHELETYNRRSNFYFKMLYVENGITNWQNDDAFKLSLLEMIKAVKEDNIKLSFYL